MSAPGTPQDAIAAGVAGRSPLAGRDAAVDAVHVVTLASTTSVPVAALIPIALVAVGFVAYCLYDLSRSPVRYLPKWAWALVCLASIPIGGVVYLLVGRDHR